MLPKSRLPEGIFYPPQTMDGIPAPVSRLSNPEDAEVSRGMVMELLESDFVGAEGSSQFWTEDMVWYGSAGFGMATSRQEFEAEILIPLREGISERSLGKGSRKKGFVSGPATKRGGGRGKGLAIKKKYFF